MWSVKKCEKAAFQNGYRRVLGEALGWAAFASEWQRRPMRLWQGTTPQHFGLRLVMSSRRPKARSARLSRSKRASTSICGSGGSGGGTKAHTILLTGYRGFDKAA